MTPNQENEMEHEPTKECPCEPTVEAVPGVEQTAQGLVDELRFRAYTWRDATIPAPAEVWDLVLEACNRLVCEFDHPHPGQPCAIRVGPDLDKIAAEAIRSKEIAMVSNLAMIVGVTEGLRDDVVDDEFIRTVYFETCEWLVSQGVKAGPE